MRRSIHLGTYFGIQVRLAYSWFIVFALVDWIVIAGYLPIYHLDISLPGQIGLSTIITVLFFISLLVHELAHSVVAKQHGLAIRRITLFIFGGAAELLEEPRDAGTEFRMAVAGPLTSLLIAAIFGGVWYLTQNVGPLQYVSVVAGVTAVLNIVVSVFNLLPAYPLDGGRILRSALWQQSGDMLGATRIASYGGYILAYLLIALGIFELLFLGNIAALWYIFIGMFLNLEARLSYLATRDQTLLDHVPVSKIMNRNVVTVEAGTTVDSFLRDFVLGSNMTAFPVIRGEQLVGIMSFAAIKRRVGVIDDLMIPVEREFILRPTDQVLKARQLLLHHNLELLPVMDGNKLVGTMTGPYIDNYLRVLSSLAGPRVRAGKFKQRQFIAPERDANG